MTNPSLAYSDRWLSIYGGDCRAVMRTLEADSIDCIVTSPPYYGLRDYGLAVWIGGDENCAHRKPVKPREERPNPSGSGIGKGGAYFDAQDAAASMYRDVCGLCGAVRVEPTVWGGDPEHEHEWSAAAPRPSGDGRERDSYAVARIEVPTTRLEGTSSTCSCGAWRGALGLEPTPQMYVANLVEVFREARRILKPTGILWLNLGDSYAANWSSRRDEGGAGTKDAARERVTAPPPGLKSKDLMLVPARVAIALVDDGWYLRSDVIWHKPNPMPESVTDRPTKSHEHVFMLAKSERYFYDNHGWREPLAESTYQRINQPTFSAQTGGDKDYGHGTNPNRSARKALEHLAARHAGKRYKHDDQHGDGGLRNANRVWGDADAMERMAEAGRNMRDVWSIHTVPYPGAHFAVFPPTLVERPILVSTSEHGCCSNCGAPWTRVLSRAWAGERNTREGTDGQQVHRDGASHDLYAIPAVRGMDLSRPQARRALELAQQHGLTVAHIEAIRAAGITDTGKTAATQQGQPTGDVLRLATEAKDALGGYYREFLAAAQVTTGWRPTCTCNAPEGVRTGDLEVIASPTGEGGDDPSMEVGRAGMARERDPNGGQRPMTRYEQRKYAEQLLALGADRVAAALASLGLRITGDEWAHYTRTDRSGARALPEHIRRALVDNGWLTEPVLPEWEPPDVVPAVVLDPFGGSGTVGLMAQRLRRRAVLIDLNPEYLEQQMERAAREFGVGGKRLRDEGWQKPPPKDVPLRGRHGEVVGHKDSLWALTEATE